MLAVEKILKNGDSPEIPAALDAALRVEADAEVRVFLQHALRVVGFRLQPVGPSVEERDGFEQRFAQAALDERRDLVARIPAAWKPSLGQWALAAFSSECDPVIRTTLLDQFAGSWSPESAEILVPLLDASSLSLRYAVISHLQMIDLPRLIQALPPLLSSPDPQTRALAITALARHDSEEASRHLEDLLLGGDPLQKQIGLRTAVILPFELSKPALLRLLAQDTSPDLLKKGGLILQINPDPEIPFHLLSLLDQGSDVKSAILKEILQESFRAIEASGILGEGFPAFVEKLRFHAQERKNLYFVRRAVDFMLSDSAWEMEEGVAALRQNMDKPGMRQALQKFLAMPIEEATRARLSRLLEGSPEPVRMAVTTYEEFCRLPSDVERAQWLAALQTEEKSLAMAVIPALFRDEKALIDTRAVALRAATRLGLPEFLPQAREWVRSDHEMLAMSALEYLARVKQDALLPMLVKFLRDPRGRLRALAGRLLGEFDQERAVEYLVSMLRSPEPAMQKSALTCLPAFDFSIIRASLIDLLEENPQSSLCDSILCLFQINPDPDNLLPLYRLARTLPAEVAPRFEALYEQTLSLLQEIRLVDPARIASLRANIVGRFDREQRKGAALPPYSLKSVKAARKEGKAGKVVPASSWSGGLPAWLNFPMAKVVLPAFAVSLCLSLTVGFWLWERQPETVTEVPSGAVLAVPLEIMGTVSEVFPYRREFLIETVDETRFLISVPTSKDLPEQGTNIRAVVTPFRSGQGKFKARLEHQEKQ